MALPFVQNPFLLKTRQLSRRQLRKAYGEIGAGLRSAGYGIKNSRREPAAKETMRAPMRGDITALRLPLLHSAPLNSYWVGLTAASREGRCSALMLGRIQEPPRLHSPLYGSLHSCGGVAPPHTSVHHPGWRAGGNLAQSSRGCSIPLASHARGVPALGPWWRFAGQNFLHPSPHWTG